MKKLRKVKQPRLPVDPKTKKKRVIISSISIFVILVIGAATVLALPYLGWFESEPTVENQPQSNVEPEPEPIHYYSPLTGLEVDSEVATTQAVTGVMIENSPEARPQSGLKNSGVVFEAIAEGGITRFLVLYQQEKPQLVGPVRSVRMYYAQWLAAFDASIAHVGGAANALIEVRNGTYRDIDQFFNSSYYWRSSDRYAPHNVYTSFDNLDSLNESKGYTTSNFTGFTRTEDSPVEIADATQINVNISSSLFNSYYTYQPETNSYLRYQGGAAHLDREEGQINPKVIIAIWVNESVVNSGGGYRTDYVTIGSGNATIFQNGTAANVTWTKASKLDQIKFTDIDGLDVPLVSGQTWISAVPNNEGSVSWQ